MRSPDFIYEEIPCGPDRIIVDADFGGAFRPFRALFYTSRSGIWTAAELILKQLANEYELWDGDEKTWEGSVMLAMLRDCLNLPGQVRIWHSFKFGEALRLCVKDKSCL